MSRVVVAGLSALLLFGGSAAACDEHFFMMGYGGYETASYQTPQRFSPFARADQTPRADAQPTDKAPGDGAQVAAAASEQRRVSENNDARARLAARDAERTESVLAQRR